MSKPGSAVDFRPEALPDIVVIMDQVNAKGRTCNPIDQACASSRCNPQIQKCKKQKNRRSCHQNRAIDIKHTIPPHQIVQKADRAKRRGQQCLDHKPAEGNQQGGSNCRQEPFQEFSIRLIIQTDIGSAQINRQKPRYTYTAGGIKGRRKIKNVWPHRHQSQSQSTRTGKLTLSQCQDQLIHHRCQHIHAYIHGNKPVKIR